MPKWNDFNGPLIQVIKDQIAREYDRIDRAQNEIIKLKLELLELGVETSPDEFVPA